MAIEQHAYAVGQATVTRIKELVLSNFTPEALFPDWDASVLVDHPDGSRRKPWIRHGSIILMSVHSWLVQDSGRKILVDPGVDNAKNHPYAPYFDRLNNPFLERLQAVGVRPEDINYVLLTLLHVDHVGWNTRLEGGRWVPTFPNARYIYSRTEYAYYSDPQNHTERKRTSFQVQKDSVEPIVESGLADMIEIEGSESIEGFTFHSTPGHNIAHASIVFESGEQRALFAGDVLHCTLEVYKPDWNTVFDAFPQEARKSRMWALKFAADHEAILFSSHFPASSAGKVLLDRSGFRWRFH